MANHGRSPDGRYPPPPDGRYPPGRGGPAGPPPRQLPPPEWADPAMGRRWTTSWRVRQMDGQPRLPTPPRVRPMPPPDRRETGANPVLAPARTTGGIRTTGGFRATGTPVTDGANTATGA